MRSAAARSAVVRKSAYLLALGQALGVEQVAGAELLGLLLGLAVDGPGAVQQVQRLLGVPPALLLLAPGRAPLGGVVDAEQLVGLVEQRHVGRRPRCRRPAGAGGRGRPRSSRGSPRRARRRRRTGRATRSLGREPRPQPVDQPVHGGLGGHLPAQRGDVGRARAGWPRPGRSRRACPRTCGRPARSRRARPPAGPRCAAVTTTGRASGSGPRRPWRTAAGCRRSPAHRRVEHGLPAADGGGDHVGHGQPALDLDDLRALEALRLQPRPQPAEVGQHHAGLAERGQHVGDVPEERRGGADDQQTAAGQPLAVGVEQVGRPVQGDRGLAGARPALDDDGRRGSRRG